MMLLGSKVVLSKTKKRGFEKPANRKVQNLEESCCKRTIVFLTIRFS